MFAQVTNFNAGSLILLAIAGLGLFGIVAFFLRKSTKDGDVGYSPVEAIAVTIAIYLVSQLIGAELVQVYLRSTRGPSAEIDTLLSHSVGVQFAYIAIVEAVSVGLLYLFLHRRKVSLRQIGWMRPHWIDIAYTLAGFVVYFVAYIALIQLVQALVPGINFNQKQELGFNTSSNTTSSLVLIFVSLVILPPLVEELLCRGFLYTGLKSRLPIVWAAIITSVLFASAHLQAGSGNALLWVAALDTFTLSMVLVGLREKTGRLWAGIGLHALKNAIAFASLFIFHIG